MILRGELLACDAGGKRGPAGEVALFYANGYSIPVAEGRSSGHRFWQVGRDGSESMWKLFFIFYFF